MKITYYVACSLDGYIALPSGDVGWLDPFMESGEDYGFAAFFESIDAIVMGSATYEFALRHPPWLAPDKKTWVFTSRELDVAHSSVTLTQGEPVEVVEEMAKSGVATVWLMGGGKLAASFRRCGLITNYVVSQIPIILGEGIPLFNKGPGLDHLVLEKSVTFESGIVSNSYCSKITSEAGSSRR